MNNIGQAFIINDCNLKIQEIKEAMKKTKDKRI